MKKLINAARQCVKNAKLYLVRIEFRRREVILNKIGFAKYKLSERLSNQEHNFWVDRQSKLLARLKAMEDKVYLTW